MIIVINNNDFNNVYKNGDSIHNIGSHFHHNTNEIVVNLPQVLKHSIDCTIEQAFTQHITHELIHKLLKEHEGALTCNDFDSLGSKCTNEIEGHFTLKDWFGGMLDKEVQNGNIYK